MFTWDYKINLFAQILYLDISNSIYFFFFLFSKNKDFYDSNQKYAFVYYYYVN